MKSSICVFIFWIHSLEFYVQKSLEQSLSDFFLVPIHSKKYILHYNLNAHIYLKQKFHEMVPTL